MNDRPVRVLNNAVLAGLSLAMLFACSAALAGEAQQSARKSAAQPAAKSSGERGHEKRGAEPSLDEQLLKDLDNDLLPAGDDLPRKRPPAGDGQAPSGDESKKPEEGADAADAGEDIGQSGEQDPLGRISDKMRQAERLIERRQSPEKTEQLHEQIVSDLAKLIEQMRKQAQQQQQQKSKKDQKTAQREKIQQPKGMTNDSKEASSTPAQDSTDKVRKNDPRRPDMAEMKNLMKDVWGQLPEHDREQMLQTPFEQFLPKYELLIEKYYKRLAEKQKDRP